MALGRIVEVGVNRLLLVFVSVVALGACSTSGVGGDGTSGIQGVVQAGPTCPVEIAGSPCPDRPFPGTVRATGGGINAQVATDDQGRFRLPLRPGSYLVTVVLTNGPATPVPQTVDVKPGTFSQVTLEVDTGIR